MSSTTHPRLTKHERAREKASALKAAAAAAEKRRRRIRIASLIAAIIAVGLVAYGLLTSQAESSTEARPAPDFTLPTTEGGTVTLSDLRGSPVVLYFNEGAGCGSCTVQMAEIEKNPGFADAGITVLPIVMNTAEQILPDLERYGATTPYLLDDGTVSAAYGTIGTGMHEGLPGHGFVLIDADGVQRWQGNYPSMWLDPADLLDEITSRL